MTNMGSFKTKEEYSKYYKEYYLKNKARIREQKNRWARNNRKNNGYFKDNARRKVFIAIRKGILQRGKCAVCNSENTEGHHFDYSKPLDVIWLCTTHHKDMHRKI